MNTPETTTPPADQLEEVSSEPKPFVNEARDADAEALYLLIEQQPFFEGFGARHLQLLADSALEIQFQPDETVFTEGNQANRFYLILEGKVVLETEMPDRNMVPVQTLGPGDDLGWSWLFSPYFHHVSARALEPTRTIFFYGTWLREECEQDHELGYQLVKRIAEVATKRLWAAQQEMMGASIKTNAPKIAEPA